MFGEAWPSESKIRRLRQSGIVAISALGNRLLILIILLAFFYVWKDDFLEILAYQKLFSTEQVPINELFLKVTNLLLQMLIAFTLACISLVGLISLLQTRFFFKPSLLQFDMSRYWNCSSSKVLPRFARFILTFLCASLIFVIMLRIYLQEVLALLNRRGEEIFLFCLQLFKPSVLVFGFFGIMVLLAVLAAKGLFLVRHRMSREEQLAEARER